MLRTAIALTVLIALGSIGASALTAATAAIRVTQGDSCATLNWATDAARYSALSAACGR